MTVAVEQNYIIYTADGTLNTFTFNFTPIKPENVLVYLYDLSNVKTQLTYQTDYSVTINSDGVGGSVTLVNTPTSGYKILIQRYVDYDQETVYPENSPFPSKSHEKALDKLTILTQQLKDKVDRSISKDEVVDVTDFKGARITNIANAVDSNDALNKGQLLSEIQAVDGIGSGIDADMLDGKQATDFVANDDNVVLNMVKNVDGLYSGLDADLVRGKAIPSPIPANKWLGSDASGNYNWKDIVTKDNKVVSQATNPDTTFDIDAGYNVGDVVINTTTNKIYVCVDNTASAAEWIQTAELSASEILDKIKTVDGTGSGLDADFVRGKEAHIKPSITHLTKSGHNSQAILINGVLYTTSGDNSVYNDSTTGRGLNDQNPFYGVDNFKRVPISTYSPIKKVDAFTHAVGFALLENGDLYTWGYNANGQCGDGTTNIIAIPKLVQTEVLNAFWHPSMGEYKVTNSRLFILKSDGLYVTGYNLGGQLGVGDTTDRSTFTKCVGLPTDPTLIKKVYPIGCSYGFTFVLADGKIYFTGTNNTGVAGNGTTTNITSFTDVTQYWAGVSEGVVDIKVSGGSRYYDTADNGSKPVVVILITLNDGTKLLRACGHNERGSLGDGTTTDKSTPVEPLNVPENDVIDIAGFGGSALTACALCSNGDLWCWGHNGDGEVGDGTATNRSTPIVVLQGVQKLFSDGMGSHKYGYQTQNFVLKDGKLYGCGYNSDAYLGIGNNTNPITTFTKVLIPNNEIVVDIGHFTTENAGRIMLALTDKSNIYAWGYNVQNGITVDSTIDSYVPVQIKLSHIWED